MIPWGDSLYSKAAFSLSEALIRHYSTSFFLASRLFPKEIRKAIEGIYGFVRVADEIVDTFHDRPQKELLDRFEADFFHAKKIGISTNPILHAFQIVVNRYAIPDEHVSSFLASMRIDLDMVNFSTPEEMNRYVYGSAEVVGLMCLRVFCRGDEGLYQTLAAPARKLGAAFQKVNFLRDLREDKEILKRNYFPFLFNRPFTEETKRMLISEIEADFAEALEGIRKLPSDVRTSVYVAYLYYQNLLNRIRTTSAEEILQRRIRVPNGVKFLLFLRGVLTSGLLCNRSVSRL